MKDSRFACVELAAVCPVLNLDVSIVMVTRRAGRRAGGNRSVGRREGRLGSASESASRFCLEEGRQLRFSVMPLVELSFPASCTPVQVGHS